MDGFLFFLFITSKPGENDESTDPKRFLLRVRFFYALRFHSLSFVAAFFYFFFACRPSTDFAFFFSDWDFSLFATQSALVERASRGPRKGAQALRTLIMTSKQTMMAPPRASAVRPAAFLQTYATAKPALRGVPIIPRSVFLQSKTQRHNVPGSSVAELRAAFTDLDVDGACLGGGIRTSRGRSLGITHRF